LGWGFALALGLVAVFVVAGSWLIALMTVSPELRGAAEQYLLFAAIAPIAGGFAYTYDGIFIGATWTRAMRNLMLISLALYLAVWWALTPWGNAGLWLAMLVFLVAREGLQALRYPKLLAASFRT